MVLSGLGCDVTEAELRSRCDCTWLGTDAFQAVKAARSLGFVRSAKHNLKRKELATIVTQGHFPIVFVDLQPLNGSKGEHALVVLAFEPGGVLVYDPAQGERLLPRAKFAAAWRMMRNLTILIEQ